MPKQRFKTVEAYKKYFIKRLEKLTPIFLKISQGDFSAEIKIPKKEDEFTPLLVSLSIILEDLRSLDEEDKRKTEELEKAKVALEEKVKERTKKLQEKIEELEKFQKFAAGREIKMIALKKEIENLKKELEKGREKKYA